ncbi:MAG: hypothetical protein ACAH83_03315 [Alphaproteobacteria bacterium]
MPEHPPRSVLNRVLSIWLQFLGSLWIVILGGGLLFAVVIVVGVISQMPPLAAVISGLFLFVVLALSGLYLVLRIRARRKP